MSVAAARQGTYQRAMWSASAAGRFQILEYVYYGLIFYSVMGEALGISIALLGAAMQAGLAVFCLFRLSGSGFSLRPVLWPGLACAFSMIGVQVLIHDVAVMHQYSRPLIMWVCALIIAQSLCTRPGFLQRFAMAVFLICLSLLPFLSTNPDGRASLDASSGVGLSNPNSLASWFGFCTVVFAIRGLETQRMLSRWVFWGVAAFSVSIVAMTVGRASMAALLLALVLALRKRLRRGFLPVLALIIVAGLALTLGFFDDAITRYTERGVEDTGRLAVWPQVIIRYFDSPLGGVGFNDISTWAPAKEREITPHNSILFVALSSGIVPLLFYLTHWFFGLRGARMASRMRAPDAIYCLPLLVFAFLSSMSGNQGFTSPWSITCVAFSLHHLAVRLNARALLETPSARVSRHGSHDLVADPR